MTPRWIDAHCHLADERLAPELESILARSRASGVGSWVQGGVDPADWDRQLELRTRYGEGVVPVFGLHPWAAARMDETSVRAALAHLQQKLPQALALGETGLDLSSRHADPASLPLQLLAFREQVAMARDAGKPLILHVVRAHGQAFECLEAQGPHAPGGLIHAFSGSYEVAQRYIRLGFVVSVGASITREGRTSLKQALKRLKPTDWVIETDSPDQPPEGVTLNEPARIRQIAEAAAELTGRDADSILDQSAATMRRILKLESTL